MFDKLKKICNNAKKLNSDKILRDIFNNSSIQQDIIDLNTEDQLYDKGIDSNGVSLGQYSPATIEGTKNFLGKKQKGQRYDHITLKDTGEFYESEKIKNQATQIVLTADANKNGTDLTKEFGKDIIGLTEENLQKVRGWVKPDIIKKTLQNIMK